jgi:hypothetical protein
MRKRTLRTESIALELRKYETLLVRRRRLYYVQLIPSSCDLSDTATIQLLPSSCYLSDTATVQLLPSSCCLSDTATYLILLPSSCYLLAAAYLILLLPSCYYQTLHFCCYSAVYFCKQTSLTAVLCTKKFLMLRSKQTSIICHFC